MIGDCFKGILFTAFLGFALLGIATTVPESAWDKVPQKLVPLRTYLAQKGVISEKYTESPDTHPRHFAPTQTENDSEPATFAADEIGRSDSGFVCSGGVCRLKDQKKEDESLKLQSRTEEEPKSFEDSPLQDEEKFLPAEEEPVSEPHLLVLNDSLSDEEKPAFIPESSRSMSGDTLPDLGFGEDSFPEDNFPIGEENESPIVRGAERDDQNSYTNKKSSANSHLKTVGHTESTQNTHSASISEEDFQANAYQFTRDNSAVPADTSDFSSSAAFEPGTADNFQDKSADSRNTHSDISLHDEILKWVDRSEGPGAITASFIRLNEILDQYDAALTPQDRETLNSALDRLAYRVFYQPDEFVLWGVYTVGEGETLASIARQHKVTPEFLAAINSLHQKENDPLPIGRELKVVDGPVTAEVSFTKMELLLKFNGLYAGRFKMGCAERAAQVRGEFPVARKIKNPEYNGPIDGGEIGRIAGGDPRNPLGAYWIELQGGLGLQGTNHEEYVGKRTSVLGGLIFSNKDIAHLNILLSEGSVVRVKD